jgi:TRAP-type C4-dicarboxylate transport system permease small subunit
MPMKALRPLGRATALVVDRLVRLERVMSAALMAGILILLSAQVFARYVLDAPITWTDELARFSLVWLTFLAAGLVQASDEHIAVLVLTTRGGPRTQRAMKYFGSLVPLFIGLVWVYTGLEPVQRGLGTTATATGLPMAVVYASTLVGFTLIMIHSARNLARIHRTGQADPGSPHGVAGGGFT